MPETVTQTLHRLTSYAPDREWTDPADDERIVQDLVVNDLERLPWFYKRYDADLPCVALPRDLPPTTAPATGVLATADGSGGAPLDVAGLARLLYLSAGVVRLAERPYGRFLYRASGSAGGRFPLEVYVAVPTGWSLPPGVHWYHPEDHALVQVGPAPQGSAPAIVVTGVPWRTGWRYRERGFRHIYWDAGTLLAQQLALADSAGVDAHLFTRFPDDGVRALVGADGVHEFPVAVVGLAGGAPALTPSGAAASGQVDRAPLHFPLVTEAQRAGDQDAWGEPWPRGAAVDADGSRAGGPTVDEVVRRRGSQRRMDPARGLAASVLVSSMSAAMRGIDVAHWVAVHAVDGTAPGLYRWPRLDAPLRRGPLRDELFRVALDQGLARDAAFVAIAAADVGRLDDREYREAQLAAGLVEGRLHLMAYALGASASGMTFLDSEIPALLGEDVDALLWTCVGVPEYAGRAAGPPGAPAVVRPVMPR